jgi:hypothetical protein
MKRTSLVSIVRYGALVGAVVAAPWMPLSVHAQGEARTAPPATKTPAGPAPRAADGHPDLSGVWWSGHDLAVQTQILTQNQGIAHDVPWPGSLQSLYNPAALAKWKSLSDKDDPTLRCVPVAFAGVTRGVSLWGVGVVGQILQTPKFVALLTETYHGFKLVPTDGRPHRDDAPPSLRGESVGRWDGDTLVVDTTNFADDNWIYAEGNVSFHSDALHIVERYRRVDANTLQVDATLEDPKVLTAPFQASTATLQLAPFDQIFEVSCIPSDTSLMDAAAKQHYGRK